MIGDASVLGLITARGGSKGIPRKNMREVGGKSLLLRTVEAALGSMYLDRLVISSDDFEIMDAAREAGCEVPFVRPSHLAEDDTPHSQVIDHALDALGADYEYFVLLQPTSPLRSTADIDGCIELCANRSAPVVISVTEFEKSPGTLVAVDEDGRLESLLKVPMSELPRQSVSAHIINGAVYVCRSDWWYANHRFLDDQTVGYAMPAERSVDVDSILDLKIAEWILSRDAGDQR